jgi:hypothetical protein
MEYVRHELVLRLNQPLSPAQLAALQRDFADILNDGANGPLQQLSAAAVYESERPELAALPRLVLRFNRRSLGRLRQFVDAING